MLNEHCMQANPFKYVTFLCSLLAFETTTSEDDDDDIRFGYRSTRDYAITRVFFVQVSRNHLCRHSATFRCCIRK